MRGYKVESLGGEVIGGIGNVWGSVRVVVDMGLVIRGEVGLEMIMWGFEFLE